MPRRTVDPRDEEFTISTGKARWRRDNDDRLLWWLDVNGVPSSAIHSDDPTHLAFGYLRIMHSILSSQWDADERGITVHLGFAAGSLARSLATDFQLTRHVGIEIDGDLISVIRNHFPFPRSVKVREADATSELVTFIGRDVAAVIRDVFHHDQTPHHLTTREYVTSVRDVLRPGGLYLLNIVDHPPLTTLRREIATISSVFTNVYAVAERKTFRGRQYANTVVVASDNRLTPDTFEVSLGPGRYVVLHGRSLKDFVAGAKPLEA